MTDTAGVEKQRIQYYPYGGDRFEENASGMNGEDVKHRFTDHEKDFAIGIYYAQARYYDQRLGRFISCDPVGPQLENPQSLNPYTYCLNNPLKYVDPTGEYNKEAIKAGLQKTLKDVRKNFSDFMVGFRAGWDDFNKNPSIVLEIANYPEQVFDAVKDGDSEELGKYAAIAYGAGAVFLMSKLLVDASISDDNTGKTDNKEKTQKNEKKITVRHYTDKQGKISINKSGELWGNDNTFVAKPFEIPDSSTSQEVEKALEIDPGRGSHYIDVRTTESNLSIPSNGKKTSGGKWQRTLKKAVKIDREKWKSTE